MATNARFVLACHLLTLLALFGRRRLTSEQIAWSVNADAAAVRRLIRSLAPTGWIDNRPGAGGGYTLTCPAARIALRDVRQAVDPDPVFGLHPSTPNAGCFVGAGIIDALQPTLRAADAALDDALGARSIADLAADIRASGHPALAKLDALAE